MLYGVYKPLEIAFKVELFGIKWKQTMFLFICTYKLSTLQKIHLYATKKFSSLDIFNDIVYNKRTFSLRRTHMKKLTSGVSAGTLIAIGGSVYLSLVDLDPVIGKIFGAIMFSVALLCICFKGFSLYTGRIGFLPWNFSKESLSDLFLGLLGNVLSTAAFGLALSYAVPALYAAAAPICEAKLTQPWWSALLRAFMCGVLMYLAVSVYKQNKSTLGIFFCIPVFILSGFEHSIANMFYFAAARIASWQSFGYIMLVILGNSLGSMFLPFINFTSKTGTQSQ